MYPVDEQHGEHGLRQRVTGLLSAPVTLWQAGLLAAVVALVAIVAGIAVSARVARLDTKVEALAHGVAELDKRAQKLDSKLDLIRAQLTAQPAKPATTQQQPSTTPAAPGQIAPKKKP